jgi:hypothetical protein
VNDEAHNPSLRECCVLTPDQTAGWDDRPVPEQISNRKLERGVAALAPFVNEWDLALNPEHLCELAYAVLVHSDGETSWEEIDAAVRAQIAEANERLRGVDESYRG